MPWCSVPTSWAKRIASSLFLTKHHGQVRAVAKGVRRTSSRFGARLEPFMVADLQLVSGRTLDIVTQAVAKGAYGSSIAADYGRFTVAAAMTETAEKLTDVDAESGTAQYNLLVGALAALSRSRPPRNSSWTPICCVLWPPGDGHRVSPDCARCGRPGPTRPFGSGGRHGVQRLPAPGFTRAGGGNSGVLGALLTGDWTWRMHRTCRPSAGSRRTGGQRICNGILNVC